MRVINTIPARPRSNRVKYYLGDGSMQFSGGGSSTVISESQDAPDEITIVPTFSQLPIPPSYGMVGLTRDNNNFWVFNPTSNIWENATIDTGVNQIVQGNNITITSTPVANSGKGVVTINSIGGSGLNFVAGNQNNSQTKNITYNSSTNTLTETRGEPYNFSYPITVGNTIVDWSPQTVQNPTVNTPTVNITYGYRVNMVAENADTSNQTSGIYFRSAAGSPQILSSGANSILQCPYQRLMPGTNISFTQSGSNITINQSGGSSGVGNVVSNTGSGQTFLRMYRYEYYVASGGITIGGYSYWGSFTITPSMVGMSMIYNQFPSISWVGQPSAVIPSTTYSGNNKVLILYNANSSPITITAGTEIDILCFGY